MNRPGNMRYRFSHSPYAPGSGGSGCVSERVRAGTIGFPKFSRQRRVAALPHLNGKCYIGEMPSMTYEIFRRVLLCRNIVHSVKNKHTKDGTRSTF